MQKLKLEKRHHSCFLIGRKSVKYLLSRKLENPKILVVQYYHGNPDMSCTQNSVAGLPWCPVIWGDYILIVQATISTINK